MAIAFDNAATGSAVNAASLTYSHTVGAGSDLALFVSVCAYHASSAPITGVTHGGVALTQISNSNVSRDTGGLGTFQSVSLWRLVAPPSGANNVVISVTAPNAGVIIGGSASFTGVHQTIPEGTAATNSSANSTTPSVTVSSTTDELVFAAILINLLTINVASGDTQRLEVGRQDSIESFDWTLNGATQVGAASVVMDWSTGVGSSTMSGVSIKVASPRPPPPRGNAGDLLASWEKLAPKRLKDQLARDRGKYQVYISIEELCAQIAARHLDSDDATMTADLIKAFENHYMEWVQADIDRALAERDQLRAEREERRREQLAGRAGWLERRKKQERNKKT